MNIEKLYSVASEILADADRLEITQLFTDFNTHLGQIVRAPNQQQHQISFVTVKDTLFDALSKSKTNYFSFAEREIIKSIGGLDVLGDNLKKRLYDALNSEGANIAPAQIEQAVTPIHAEYNVFFQNIKQMADVFGRLNIGQYDELEKGQGEVTFLLPRNLVNGDFKSFESDIKLIRELLDRLREITGENYKITKISSSDFIFWFLAGASFIYTVSKVINSILEVFVNIDKLRDSRAAYKTQGLDNKIIKELKKFEDNMLDEKIKRTVQDIFNEAKIDKSRQNEIQDNFIRTIGKIAAKLDKGYQITASLQYSQEAGEDAKFSKTAKAIQELNINANIVVRAIETSGQPILGLPEPEGKQLDGADNEGSA